MQSDFTHIGKFAHHIVHSDIEIAENKQAKFFLGGYILFGSHRAHSPYYFLSRFHGPEKRVVGFACSRHRSIHYAFSRTAVSKMLPKFFRNERHEWMQHP